MIISIDTEKHLIKSNIHSRSKLSKTQNKREHPQLDKEYFQKPTDNIMLHDEKLKAFPLRSATR